jgi:hypothetical protein
MLLLHRLARRLQQLLLVSKILLVPPAAERRGVLIWEAADGAAGWLVLQVESVARAAAVVGIEGPDLLCLRDEVIPVTAAVRMTVTVTEHGSVGS